MDTLEYVWAAGGVVFGCAVGLLFVGYLIKPSIHNWDGTTKMRRLFFSVAAFLVGGGGGTAIMATFSDATPWYLVGVGGGIIWGCFHKPILMVKHSFETVTAVIHLSEALRDRLPDINERSATVLALLAPMASSKQSEKELADKLGTGLDRISEQRNENA